ncbi:MAG TPA: hypothetical protein VN281_02760 [Verrucomicrobiae bacterium]|nr:hypothetical protein [Verrucomicrobiae bacterium]
MAGQAGAPGKVEDRPSLGSFGPPSKVEEPPSLGSYGAPSKVKNKVLWNGLERSKFNIFDMWAN